MKNFWKTLHKPFTALAPMDGVTDYVFREIIAETAKPDVFFTEFTNTDALTSKGYDKVVKNLKYSEEQKPIIAQVWGINPESFYKTAQIISKMGFEGIDINMGCPDKAVNKIGAGAALIKDANLAKEIISATKKGAPNLAISVKTRIGFDKVITEEWITFLLEQNIDALTIHGRTAAELSKVDADWEEIGKAVKIKNKIAPQTIIIGNGDIKSYDDAMQKSKKYKVDGVMIGRGIFSDPWIFNKTNKKHTKQEHFDLLLKHTQLYCDTYGTKNFETMRKFFKVYVSAFPGANALKQQLMACKNYDEVKTLMTSEKSQ
jgi:nifR3 family TIM-barrel protein